MSFEELRTVVLAQAVELKICHKILHAPEDATIFLGAEFNRAWCVMNIFLESYKPDLLQRGEAFQTNVEELLVLVQTWMMDPRVWTRGANGFKVLPANALFTKDEPTRSIRRTVMEKLESMQKGSAKAFCELINMLSEKCYAVLAGDPYHPAAPASANDFETGRPLPRLGGLQSGILQLQSLGA